MRQVISYIHVQFLYKTGSIVVYFNATCLKLLISLAGNQSTNNGEVGMLWYIIIRNWALCIKYIITYFYRNGSTTNCIM